MFGTLDDIRSWEESTHKIENKKHREQKLSNHRNFLITN